MDLTLARAGPEDLPYVAVAAGRRLLEPPRSRSHAANQCDRSDDEEQDDAEDDPPSRRHVKPEGKVAAARVGAVATRRPDVVDQQREYGNADESNRETR